MSVIFKQSPDGDYVLPFNGKQFVNAIYSDWKFEVLNDPTTYFSAICEDIKDMLKCYIWPWSLYGYDAVRVTADRNYHEAYGRNDCICNAVFHSGNDCNKLTVTYPQRVARSTILARLMISMQHPPIIESCFIGDHLACVVQAAETCGCDEYARNSCDWRQPMFHIERKKHRKRHIHYELCVNSEFIYGQWSLRCNSRVLGIMGMDIIIAAVNGEKMLLAMQHRRDGKYNWQAIGMIFVPLQCYMNNMAMLFVYADRIVLWRKL